MLTVLRSLINPRMDYCCQLWSPRDQASINRIERVQMNFVRQIEDESLRGQSYWEKLRLLNISSQERRRERAIICFLWKVSQGLVEGFEMQWMHSERRGRLAVLKPYRNSAPSKVKSATEKSIWVHGAKLFNLLPRNLRNENSGDYALFKNNLDIFLMTIPDQPTLSGHGRAASSNSLVDQIKFHLF